MGCNITLAPAAVKENTFIIRGGMNVLHWKERDTEGENDRRDTAVQGYVVRARLRKSEIIWVGKDHFVVYGFRKYRCVVREKFSDRADPRKF